MDTIVSNSDFQLNWNQRFRDFEPSLYTNEIENAIFVEGVERTKRFHPLKGGASGDLGSLMCSLYRLTFSCPLESNSLQDSKSCVPGTPRPKEFSIYKSCILRKGDILLSNINRIVLRKRNIRYVVTAENSLVGIIHCYSNVEILCADFSVHEFKFIRNKRGSDAKHQKKHILKFLNVLVRDTFPSSKENYFPLVCHNLTEPQNPRRLERVALSRKLFDAWMSSPEGKGSVLSDIKCSGYFDSNKTLPSFCLMPVGWYSSHVERMSQLVEDYRGPVFCCSLPSTGCQLIRSASFIKTCEYEACLREFSDIVVQASQAKDKQPQLSIIKLEEKFPSLSVVQQSYNKLRELCQPQSQDSFEDKDAHWLEALNSTGWPTIVTQVLYETNVIVKLLTESSVLILEPHGRDLTCLVACLVQICISPKCRLRSGFEALIDREWVQMGHDFPRRQEHYVHTAGVGMPSEVDGCELFPLFIDCVYQLLRQFPFEFDFSEDYLLFLTDATRMPCFIEFSFSCENERAHVTNLRSVWQWEDFLTKEAFALIENPLYKLRRMNDQEVQNVSLLVPESILIAFVFWEHAYFRWIAFLHSFLGGSAATTFRYRELLNQLEHSNTAKDDTETDILSILGCQRDMTSGYPFSVDSNIVNRHLF